MTTPDEADLTAAELALGVLEGEERAAALRRLLADPAFAREVEQWRRRLSALYFEVPSVEPSIRLEHRIMAPSDGAKRNARRWRAVAGIAALAAAILLVVAINRPAPSPVVVPVERPAPLQIAVLAPANAEPVAIVFSPAARTIQLRGSLTLAKDRDAELWAINGDGVPHAAGLLRTRGDAALTVAPGVTIAAGTTLAISIEPLGGSPKPTPTGPVVATGKLAAIS